MRSKWRNSGKSLGKPVEHSRRVTVHAHGVRERSIEERGDALLELNEDMRKFVWLHEGDDDAAEQWYGTQVNLIGDAELEGTVETSDDDIEEKDAEWEVPESWEETKVPEANNAPETKD